VIARRHQTGAMSAVTGVAPDLIATATLTIETRGEGFTEFTGDAARFLAEARMAGNISHDNIISIYDFGEDEKQHPFMVMEFLRGEDMRHAIKNGHFDRALIPIYHEDGTLALDHEEFPRPQTTLEGLAALKPSFEALADIAIDESGATYRSLILQRYPNLDIRPIHHPGNSSGVVDGSGAVLLASPETAIDMKLSGAQSVRGDVDGRKMGRLILGRGHMGLLPKGAAYRFQAEQPAAAMIQTIEGPLTVQKWSEICQTS